MTQAFSALSTVIWGLVVAKANNGFKAAKSSDHQSVGGMLKKTGMLCGLIVVGSIATFFSSTPMPSKPILQSAKGPASDHIVLADHIADLAS